MKFLAAILLAVLIAVATAAPAQKFFMEIMEKNQTAVTARFSTTIKASKYHINVAVKYLMDVSAHYYTTFTESDKQSDGYFYIETGNTLQSGTLYEVLVITNAGSGSIDVFTDCDDYTFSCETSGIMPMCLTSSQLCNGQNDCSDGSDEVKDENGTCTVSVPDRPTTPPPPPTAGTPCLKALAAAEASGISNVPACDGDDGHYAPMTCENFIPTCHCMHPITNEVLHSVFNFDPFVNWNFYDTCVAIRKIALPA